MNRRPGFILATIFWAAAILAIAIVAVGLQLDRASRKDAALAQMVPSAFRGYALETLAQEAYAAGDNQTGLAYSRELVLRRPIPAEGLSLLTKGLLGAGKEDEALRALLLAAQRGWRDRFTQQLMVASAIQVDDPQVAAQRLLALWRLGDRSDQTMAVTQSILTSRSGLEQFTKGIVKADAWGTGLLVWAANTVPASSNEAVAKALADKHVAVDCRTLSGTVRRLAQTGQGQTAVNLWSTLCAQGTATRASDFDFKSSEDDAGPFDWNFPDQAGLDVSLVDDAGKVSLQYDYAEQIRVVVASRNAALSAGHHTARLEATGAGGIESRPTVLQITCFANDGTPHEAARVQLDRQAAPFQIPATGCAAQEIKLIVSHGSGRLRRLVIAS